MSAHEKLKKLFGPGEGTWPIEAKVDKGNPEKLVPYPQAVPEDVKQAAKRVKAWMDTAEPCPNCGLEHREGEYAAAHPKKEELVAPGITITQDQWEGLQFELSEIKSEIAELQSAVFVPSWHEAEDWFANEGWISKDWISKADIERVMGDPEEPAKPDVQSWGMDVSFDVRPPEMVTLVNGVPGLEMGPFVLITPEERIILLNTLNELSQEADESYQGLAEAENVIEEIRYWGTPKKESYPPRPYQHVTGWPHTTTTTNSTADATATMSWTTLVEEGPDDDEPDTGVPAKV